MTIQIRRTREDIWADLQAAWDERKAVTDRLWDLRQEYLRAEEAPGHLTEEPGTLSLREYGILPPRSTP